jgi:alpha-beta hydrolase superfamily lysophospholipase
MSEKPVILIIGGGWHTPASYAKLTTALKDTGYEVHCPAHASVSSKRPPVAGLKEDTAAIRNYVEDLLQTGKRLLVIAHSYGGQLASNSLHGQSVESRAARGLSGGVAMLIYMCAFALEEGRSSKPYGCTCRLELVWVVLT